MTRITRIIAVATMFRLGAAWAQERPVLPEDVAAEVAGLEETIEAEVTEFLRGEILSLDATIGRAERLVEIRTQHQAGWTDSHGDPADWYEVVTARRRITDLRMIARLDDAQRTVLDDALTKGQRGVDTVRAGRASDGVLLLQSEVASLNEILGSEHAWTLEAMHNVASAMKSAGEPASAESRCRETLQVRTRVLGDAHPDTLVSLHQLGNLHADQGRLSESETVLREVLAGRRHVFGTEHPATLEAASSLGFTCRLQGNFVDAERFYSQVLEVRLRVSGDDHRDTLTMLNNMGVLMLMQARYAEAEPYLRQVVERSRRILGDEHPRTLNSIGNLGGLLYEQGKGDEAEPYLVESMNGMRRMSGNDHPNTLIAVSRVGVLYMRLGRLEEAEPFLRESAEGFRRVLGDGHPASLQTASYIGMLLEAQGKIDEAEPYYRRTLETRRTTLGNDHLRTMESVGNMGYLLAHQGKLLEAEELMRESVERRRRVLGDDHAATLNGVLSLAGLLLLQENVEEAEAHYRDAFTTALRLRGLSTGGERGRAAMAERVDLGLIVTDLTLLLARRGDFVAAWDVIERGRGRALLDLLTRSEHDVSEQLPDSSDLEQEQERELDARERVSVVERELQAQREHRSAIEQDQTLSDAERTELLREQDALIARQFDVVDRARRDLGDATAQVFLALQHVIPDAQPLTLDEIQIRLEPGDAVCSYWWGDSQVLLIVVTNEEVVGHLLAESEESVQGLDAMIASSRDAMVHGSGLVSMPGARELWERLLPEAVRDVVSRASRVVVLPDGPLHGIPMEALANDMESPDLDDGRQQIVYASSASVYLNRRELARARVAVPGPGRVVALGGAMFDLAQGEMSDQDMIMSMLRRSGSSTNATISAIDQIRLHGDTKLSSLPFSRAEAMAVSTLAGQAGLTSTLLIGSEATLGRLESALPGTTYLHLATHGLVGSQARPYDASLALTQPENPSVDDIGFLTLDHLIRDWRGRLNACDLVVLSACDTQRGITKGDALMALPWGFFYAGAPTVVASLWQVDDDATAKLMTRFYENLLGAHDDARTIRGIPFGSGQRMSKADALQEAKRWLRMLEEADTRGVARGGDETPNRPYAHPYYWAPFVLIGDPG